MKTNWQTIRWFMLLMIGGLFGWSVQAQKLPNGFKSDVFADSSQVGNVVAIDFDSRGRLFTTEIHRRETGVWGVTFSRWWAMEDYRGQSLETRMAMYDRWSHVVTPAMLTRESDEVRWLEDRDGDGKADAGGVFTGGFNEPLSGNAAGVLAHDGKVYLANIPSLWALEDRDGDGGAELREELLTGFGARVGVHAHDLHGLIVGPDGRLYFTVGDRGFNVTSKEGENFKAPTRGAVFRCFPDGSGLEVFHHGLRNPQELAFNDLGDLFTVDNNMGGGDLCRILHLREGDDSAWDATYQLTRNFREETQRADHPEPPWFSERLFGVPHAGQPQWQNRPVGHLTRGPSGLVHYPGTGMPEDFDDTFFVCDFVGSAARSGILTFKLEQSGAGYELQSTNVFAWGALVTDLTFSDDGRVYFTDWINGWGGKGERMIRRAWHPESQRSAGANDAFKWLRAEFGNSDRDHWIKLLNHQDRRVRSKVQQFIVKHRSDSVAVFEDALLSGERMASIHALWGLWQIGLIRENEEAKKVLLRSVESTDFEIQAQALRVLGDLRWGNAELYQVALETPSKRVQYRALMGLAKLKSSASEAVVLRYLKQCDLTDLALRHGLVSAMAVCVNEAKLAEMVADSSIDRRLVAVHALRRSKSSRLKAFLKDQNMRVRFEAIRAVHDLGIEEAWNDLAGLVADPFMKTDEVPFPIAHRVLNANFRKGDEKAIRRIEDVAVDDGYGAAVRKEAMDQLLHWSSPSDFDRVTWHYRPLKGERGQLSKRDQGDRWLGVISEGGDLGALAAKVVARFDLVSLVQGLNLAMSKALPVELRLPFVERQFGTGKNEKLSSLLDDPEWRIRFRVGWQLSASGSEQADGVLLELLNSLKGSSQSEVIRSMEKLERPFVDSWIGAKLSEAGMEALPNALDIVEVAELRRIAGNERKAILEKLNREQPDLGKHALTLNGGDATSGKELFMTHAVQCVRCHRVKRFGGEAGPDLSRIGRELDGKGLLQALVDPSARIAPGFGFTEFELPDDDIISGFVQNESDKEAVVKTIDGRVRTIQLEDVIHRAQPTSAMPSMKESLTLVEIRDLVAYLKTLK